MDSPPLVLSMGTRGDTRYVQMAIRLLICILLGTRAAAQ